MGCIDIKLPASDPLKFKLESPYKNIQIMHQKVNSLFFFDTT